MVQHNMLLACLRVSVSLIRVVFDIIDSWTLFVPFCSISSSISSSSGTLAAVSIIYCVLISNSRFYNQWLLSTNKKRCMCFMAAVAGISRAHCRAHCTTVVWTD